MTSERDASFTLTSLDEGRSLRLPNLRVTVTLPDRNTVTAPLGLAPLVLGKSAECDLVVTDPKVSRVHCEIRLTEQGVLLKDIQSRNGTFIRDVRVVEAFLSPGVPATVGDSTLVVQPSGGAAVLPLSMRGSFGDAVGEGLAMRALFARLERVAKTDETILLLGESGTGKEVLARSIHQESRRAHHPYVVVDCGAILSSTIEAELFGTVPGAATGAVNRAGFFEAAHQGTIFIDEIGELPLEAQQKLLRVIEARTVRRVGSPQERAIDVRIVAATHRNLKAMVAEGKFRQDLYFRLSVLELQVPPLRERREDIPLLAERFLSSRHPPLKASDLPPETLPMLMGYDWPGNVRELRNVIARLVVFPELLHEILGPTASPTPGSISAPPPRAAEAATADAEDSKLGRLLELSLPEAREAVLAELERKYATAKLRKYDGNISRAAESMGVSRQLLHRLLDRHGIRAKEGTHESPAPGRT
ncbi:sigma 54-interacting transcriptional regulator [Polyangium sp. 6x1]|uniref:sigma 54-interacting transcriptional regulator n=1 Tax=Polyangium sp. 6x1 TaxID=3042689 RepID=UPI002482C952|nr:sigma 54-interacting transcriptional regulator [Polyangium sp. 6x1]MDI1442714.1 sigma 54-interacting transcriptional regulator [Polyangium sp. 6x1]